MIVTKQQLQQLIDEEYSRALLKRKKKLTERLIPSHDLYELEAYELIRFAKAYRDLGDAVTDQLDTILDGAEDDFHAETNSNAIKMIEDELGGINEEIDEAVKAYNEWWESSGKTGDTDRGREDDDDGTYAAAARANGMKVRR